MAHPLPVTGTPSRPRFVLLDLLRIGAALWVVVFHWTLGTNALASAPAWFADMARAGYLGVDVFFMLSGAVIAYTALGRTWGEFGVARFLRLAPAFFGATVLTIAFLAVTGEFEASPLSWLNLTGLHFFFGEPSFVSVAWTLLYELQFYILIALLILISRNNLTEAGIRGGATVFLILALFAEFSGNRELTIVTISGFGGMFAFGALLGISRTREQLQRNLPPLLLAACLVYAKLVERIGDMHLGDAGTVAWSLGILLVVGGVILLSALRPIDVRLPWMRSSIATFALMTYPIYLLHLELGKGSLTLLWEAGIPVPLALAIAAAALFLVSWLFVRYYEPLARSLLRRVFGWSTAIRYPAGRGLATRRSGRGRIADSHRPTSHAARELP